MLNVSDIVMSQIWGRRVLAKIEPNRPDQLNRSSDEGGDFHSISTSVEIA